MSSLEHRVERRCRRWMRSGIGPNLVVAVSGGGDSVAMLRLLDRINQTAGLGWRLSAAHFHHGARGEAAWEDAEFVRALAERLGLAFDLGRWAPSRSGGFESEARRARYDWLAKIARSRGAGAVAAGHTLDDQAETILHRVARGSGLRGLAGIPARRPLAPGIELIRPLLEIPRAELRAWLAGIGESCREDATNADTSRTRSRIRHQLLPLLVRDYNPNAAAAIARLGRLARVAVERDERRWASAVDRIILKRSETELILDRTALARRSSSTRAEWIRLAWRLAGWPEGIMDHARWRRLAGLAGRSRGRSAVAGRIEACSDETQFRLTNSQKPPGPPPSSKEAIPDPVALDIPGAADWRGGRIAIRTDDFAGCQEVIDADRVQPPLIVRGPRVGDRFEPLGMGGRGKPLSDYLCERRAPRESRPFVPLVCDAAGIVWVVGFGICDRVKRTETTTRLLGMAMAMATPPL